MKSKRKRTEPVEPAVDEAVEVAGLEEQVVATAPPRGTQPFTDSSADRQPFTALPLSQRTMRGLTGGGFKTMTEIQVAAIPHALAGRDVLGAAKTGSGKTLAFLVPLVEKLYRSRITFGDGLAALVISPTRELSLQIFEVLREFGKHHQLSAGLITGGKKEFREEQVSVVKMNILVATPGRLLQHLEQTPGFDPSLLQVLVLDEADRILDMGFRDQLNSILEYLPPSRQTMLFSATQTKSIKDLARLSLKKGNVEYVAVRAGKDECATPAKLVQNYVVSRLDKKLDVLLGFIKTHLKSKMIVFFTSCAQVRFAFELLCALQPGMPVMALHGKCKHARRTQIYLDFVRRPGAVLLATDIAARGLDFPSVDWVIQVDAPEDAEGYIHRVGRTARYNSGGRALMMVLPSEEEAVLAGLKPKNIPIKKLTINPEKVRMAGSVGKKAASFVASDPDKKRLAEKSFTSYVRAVQLMPNKKAFRVSELPLEDYAFSLGLAAAPRVPGLEKALQKTASVEQGVGGSADDGGAGDGGGTENERQREEARAKKNVNRSLQRLKEQIKAEKLRKRMERESKSEGASASTSESRTKKPRTAKMSDDGSDSDGDGDSSDSDDSDSSEADGGLVLVQKKTPGGLGEGEDGADPEESADAAELERSRSKKKEKKMKKMRITSDGVAASGVATKRVFREDGTAVDIVSPLQAFAKEAGLASTKSSTRNDIDTLPAASEAYVQRIKAKLDAVDGEDKARDRARVREKHLKRRLKSKDMEDAAGAPTLGGSSSSDDSDAGSSSGGSEDSDSNSDGDDDDDDEADSPLIVSSDRGSSSRDSSDEEETPERGEGHDRRARGGGRKGSRVPQGATERSLEEQEDEVLAMLAARQKK
ncbi:unnamed protein product [Scytosiphon promiscuus]